MGAGDGNGDRLTRWRKRTRARMLEWMPLGAWKGLLGILILLTAGILRKVELIREPGFALLLSIGLALLGYQQVVNGKRGGKPPEGK